MDPRFGLLLACFFLSGFAALLYQTAWTRELSFVFGTSALAVAAVLAAYMGGLALGAAAAARFAGRLRRPVLAYGVLELGIAVCALLVPWGIRAVNGVYVALLGGVDDLPEPSALATFVQLSGAFAVLLIPTAFMGATLPLLARHAVHREEEIAPRVGVLYAVNTAGAIAGTICAAFLLMPELGLRRTVWTGAAMNALVFGLAALLARSSPLSPAEPGGSRIPWAAGTFWILPAIAISGAISFAYEVMWTRLLGHLLGASVHAFASMLASFLTGIALGSAVAARLATTRERSVLGFTLSQLGIAVTSYATFALSDWLPQLSARLGAGPAQPLASAGVAAAALLPITLCIGATFPFAVRVLAHHPDQAAAATARVYAWNTLGAIVGSLGAGFVLLPMLGFEGVLNAGVAASLALAALAAVARRPRRVVPLVAAAAAGLVLSFAPAGPPWMLLMSSPMKATSNVVPVAYSAVGRTTHVLLTDLLGRSQLLTDGLPEAWIDGKGVLPQINVAQWLGALPAFVRPEARKLLVIGLGGGNALELAPSSYESIDVIELEPEVLNANRFAAETRAIDPLSDPRVRVHIGDARGTLELAGTRYDAIVSQPSHPWTAGASHLYTREFFSLVRSRLEPNGVFVQWIGISFVDAELLRTLLSALVEAFPHVELFQPRPMGLLFVASSSPIDALAGAARAFETAPADLARLGMHRLEDFASAWALDAAGVRALAEGAPPNTDDHNHLASRSARLGERALDSKQLRALLGAHDPLYEATGLDLTALVRSILIRGQAERAQDVATASEGAPEESALGWVELAAGRSGRAARHFQRALSLAPDHSDAMAGLIASRKILISSGELVPGVSDRELSPPHAALIAGWRHAEAREWKQVAALDAQLARIAPGDGLFGPATRLRIAMRLAANDVAAADQAQALVERLLLRSWQPFDVLLRARAALKAGRPRDAASSLIRLPARIQTSPRGRLLAERALEIAQRLPPGEYDQLRDQLAAAARGTPTSPGSFRGRPAPRGNP